MYIYICYNSIEEPLTRGSFLPNSFCSFNRVVPFRFPGAPSGGMLQTANFTKNKSCLTTSFPGPNLINHAFPRFQPADFTESKVSFTHSASRFGCGSKIGAQNGTLGEKGTIQSAGTHTQTHLTIPTPI